MLRVKRRASKPKRISVQLTSEEVGTLQEIASIHERSLSWVAARAIRHYLADNPKGSQAVGVGTPGAEAPPK